MLQQHLEAFDRFDLTFMNWLQRPLSHTLFISGKKKQIGLVSASQAWILLFNNPFNIF